MTHHHHDARAAERAAYIESLERFAEGRAFRLNPDRKVVEGVVGGLIKRRATLGKALCPCRRATGVAEEDAKIECPCVYLPDEVRLHGHCHCGLFVALPEPPPPEPA